MVCLTGFMGSGKSTVGRLLAAQLAWHFYDLDTEIERHAGSPISQVFVNSIRSDCPATSRLTFVSRVAANPCEWPKKFWRLGFLVLRPVCSRAEIFRGHRLPEQSLNRSPDYDFAPALKCAPI